MYYKRIEEMRIDHDFTQQQVADYLKIHREVYRRYEKGIRTIPAEFLIQLAEYYHTSTDYLLGLTDDSSPVSQKAGQNS